MRSIHNLALIGFMGTGKSGVGRVVADLMHFTFLDTDHVIEARAGKPISDIFAQDGEPAAYPEALDFHRRVLELSGNLPLLRAGSDLQMQVRIARVRSGRSPVRARAAIGEHFEIVSAMCDRDPDAAGEAMSRHLANSLVSVAEVLEGNVAGLGHPA